MNAIEKVDPLLFRRGKLRGLPGKNCAGPERRKIDKGTGGVCDPDARPIETLLASPICRYISTAAIARFAKGGMLRVSARYVSAQYGKRSIACSMDTLLVLNSRFWLSSRSRDTCLVTCGSRETPTTRFDRLAEGASQAGNLPRRLFLNVPGANQRRLSMPFDTFNHHHIIILATILDNKSSSPNLDSTVQAVLTSCIQTDDSGAAQLRKVVRACEALH